VVAGILSIISGIVGFLTSGFALCLVFMSISSLGKGNLNQILFRYPEIFADALVPLGRSLAIFVFVLCIWAFCAGLLGTLAIVGGILAIKKKRWGLALTGTLASVLTFLPLGIIAVMLVSLSRGEFIMPKPAVSV